MKCHELEQWLADYFAEDLTISQVDELMEHLGSCKACRAEFEAYQRQEEQLNLHFKGKLEPALACANPLADLPTEEKPRPLRSRPLYRWGALAAVLALTVLTASTWLVYRRAVPTGQAVLAKVKAAEGRVAVLEGGTYQVLAAGAPIHQAQRIKVPAGGYLALELPNGNIVEARGGTQLALESYPDRLEVAMHQGHLWAHLNAKPPKPFVVRTRQVTTRDIGTVFGVEEGLDRTIVDVAKGIVEVTCGGTQTRLEAGQSYCSRPGAKVGTRDLAVAWSHFQGDLASLLDGGALASAGNTSAVAASAASETAVTTGTEVANLLDLLPTSTPFFLDISDWPGILGEFKLTDYQTLLSEPTLQAWWAQVKGKDLLDRVLTELVQMGVIDLARSMDGQVVLAAAEGGNFLLMADCRAKEQEVSAMVNRLLAGQPVQSGTAVALVDPLQASVEATASTSNPAAAWKDFEGRIFVGRGRLILSSSKELAAATYGRLRSGEPTGFTETPFSAKLAQWAPNSRLMMAADFAEIRDKIAKMTDPVEKARCELLGLNTLDTMLISPSFAGRGMNQAARVSFTGQRGGALNWLAEPSPMRGFNFFSPDVHFFASAIVRSPRQIIWDFIDAERATGDTARADALRDELMQQEGLYDGLGGEVAIGIDNPILPMPNVKIAIEVSNRAAVEAGINAIVQKLIAQFEAEDRFAWCDVEDYNGYKIYSLKIDGVPFDPSWAFVDDFLVGGPGNLFVRHSIDVWQSGRSIGSDSHLLTLLPSQASPTLSLLVYQDVASAIPELVRSKIMPSLDADAASFAPDVSFLERYRAAGIAYAEAQADHVDFFLQTPGGLDFNVGMAVPLVANWLAPRLNVSQTADLIAEAKVRLDELKAAAEAYRAAKGSYPAALSDLADGKYIERIPADPFAVTPGDLLRLAPGAQAGQILLYSIGPDKVDDKGLTLYDPENDIEGTGDIVVRLPEEAAAPAQ